MYPLIGVLLIYIGLYYNTLSTTFYTTLFFLGILFLFIQAVLLFLNFKYTNPISIIIVFPLLLCFLVGSPLLIYIGYKKKDTPPLTYKIGSYLGVFFICYYIIHSYYIYNTLKTVTWIKK